MCCESIPTLLRHLYPCQTQPSAGRDNPRLCTLDPISSSMVFHRSKYLGMKDKYRTEFTCNLWRLSMIMFHQTVPPPPYFVLHTSAVKLIFRRQSTALKAEVQLNYTFVSYIRVKQERHCTIQQKLKRSQYYRGKAISTTLAVCVFVALVIQHARSMRHIVICGLSGFTLFLHIISWFSNKVVEHKIRVLIFSTAFVWNNSYSKKKWTRYEYKWILVDHVKYPLRL